MSRTLVVSAPGRANLIGNPTDIYGGAVLSCSVDLRAHVRLEAADGLLLATEGAHLAIRDGRDLAVRGDLFDVARAVVAHVGLPGLACRVEYASGIPLRSGLAGSTALVVSLLHALGAWRGRTLGPYELAETARRIELSRLRVVCGYVDHYMCTFGGLRYLDFRGKGIDRADGEQPFATVEPLDGCAPELPFVLAFTGVQHSSGAVHSPIRERWLAGDPEVVAGYERVGELARLGKRAFLTGDFERLGALMNENHAIQRDLGGSGEPNERLVAAALAGGALGAKLAGAGNGGTIVALCRRDELARVESALREAGAAALYRPSVTPGVRIETA
jgi:galactokinase/mevalonate kinase-like predicted kinase